jgi:hypothetical protein
MSQRRDKTVGTRFNNDELEELENKCITANMKTSEFIRKAVSSSIIQQKDIAYQKRVLYLLSRISTNVNQIAKHSNTHKVLDYHVLQELRALKSFINKIDLGS